MKISITVEPDDFTAKVAQAFDLEFDGTITTEIPDFEPPETGSYNIGMRYCGIIFPRRFPNPKNLTLGIPKRLLCRTSTLQRQLLKSCLLVELRLSPPCANHIMF